MLVFSSNMMQLILEVDICAFIRHETFKSYMLCLYHTLPGVLSTAIFVIAKFPQSLNLPLHRRTGNGHDLETSYR
jgi:hypothetical protein